MARIRRLLVVGHVASRAGRVGRRQRVVHMAGGAGDRDVRTRQRPTGGRVIECPIGPGGCVMAGRAGCRETRLDVIHRTRRRVVVGQVAAHTSRVSRGETVVVVYVARRAGHADVRTRERKSRRAVIEGRRLPARRRVARLAGGRKCRQYVVRTRRRLIVRHVARRARRIRRAQVVVVIDMAGAARDAHVRARQRESRLIVIEGRRLPRGRRVADLARSGNPRLGVIRISRALKIREVARGADGIRRGQVVIVIHMTGGARNAYVRARQREPCLIVIESCRLPRGGRVADFAGGRNPGLNVIRIRGALKIRHVASRADGVRRGQVVVVVHVATGAGDRYVRARERESGRIVIEGRRLPRDRRMARFAGSSEAAGHVIRVRGALKVQHVAGRARRIHAAQAVVVVDVARSAGHGHVRPSQRESS